VKTLDLRQHQISVDELLQLAGADTVRIMNKNGDEFILEAVDWFEREVAELGRSEKFQAFLTERSKEPGRTTLAEIERRLASTEPVDDED
jgi:hypothetical protein